MSEINPIHSRAGCAANPQTNPLTPFRYSMPVTIRFGQDCMAAFAETVAAFGKAPMVITGQQSAKQSGALDDVLAALGGAIVFSGVEENPTDTTVDAAAHVCRENNCDVIVAIGGGSPMDVAKAVAGLARNEGPCAQYFGKETFPNGAVPIITVPTTAGTGSEVTPYAIVVDSAKGQKKTIGAKCLFPKEAFLNPAYTVTMPRDVTANTGLDALSQLMEGMLSKKSTPMGDLLAIEGCRIVKRWLPVAVADGANLEARKQMLYAAMLSGCIIAQSGTTLVHGMGYYYTLGCGVAHGLANALLLSPLFQYNAQHEPEKVAALAGVLGIPAEADPDAAASAIGEALHMLLLECGVSPAAKDAGVEESKLAGFAADVASDPYRFRNQVGDLTEEDVLGFYEASYGGVRV